MLVAASISFAGCNQNVGTKIAKSNEVSQRASAPPSNENLESQNDDSVPNDRIRLLAFSAPKGWSSRPPKIGNGVVMFAPENAAWTDIGFRPNLSVKISDNPGLSLGQLESLLMKTLASDVEQLNTTLFVDAKPVLDAEGRSLKIEDLKFELRQSALKDGYPCLNSESFGAFNLDGKIVKTVTYSIALVDSTNIYITSIIIPLSHKEELQQSWDRFKDTLRFGER